jgi:hypothetical protein
MSRRLFLLLVVTTILALVAPKPGRAQVTTTARASVLLFPLVVAGNGRDTVVSIARAWAFPEGDDATVAARVRDTTGMIDAPCEVIIRVPPAPSWEHRR